MVNIQKINPMARAIGVIGAVAALVTATTFAVLTSNPVVLADSSFSTGTAALQIWDDGASQYVTTPVNGFSFTNVAPDVQTGAFTFWLRNNGTLPLDIFSIGTVVSTPNITDPSGVEFEVTNLSLSGGGTTTFSLTTLVDGVPDLWPDTSASLDPGEENQYSIKLKVLSSAITGSSASMNDLDLTFTGTNP